MKSLKISMFYQQILRGEENPPELQSAVGIKPDEHKLSLEKKVEAFIP